jgi:hypothetical protein
MTVARNAGEALSAHAALGLERIDRMRLNVRVPMLQSGAGTAHFLRHVRGSPVPSSAPMARRFAADLERFARGAASAWGAPTTVQARPRSR